MAYEDFKDLSRRTIAEKILRDKAFNIAKNPIYDEYQWGFASMVYKFLDKKTSNTNKGTGSNSENKQFAKELHKVIIKKCEKRKVHSALIDNIWDADLADMQLLSKFNKGILRNIFSKYAWVVPLNNEKGITITDVFQKILCESGGKLIKIWVGKNSEFYKRTKKSWLQDNDIEMYSRHNEQKSVAAERFIKNSKNKIDTDINSISKNVHIDKLGDINKKYNNTCHRSIKMKPVDVKSKILTLI